MAFPCVFNCDKECDGCGSCEEESKLKCDDCGSKIPLYEVYYSIEDVTICKECIGNYMRWNDE